MAPWAADPERIATTQERANTQARQFWQRASWTRRRNITNLETTDRPLADSVGGQGSVEVIDFGAADAVTIRRAEDERYAWFMESTVIDLDLPDAVYRGYEGDDQLLGAVRDDDLAPIDLLRREILRLEPQMVYFPLGIGGHVDHQLCREVGVALLGEGTQWVMPGPDMVGSLSFYEDFPYAWWNDFSGVADLPDLETAGGHLARAAQRGHQRHAGAQGRRPGRVREPDRAPVRVAPGHARRPRRLPRPDRRLRRPARLRRAHLGPRPSLKRSGVQLLLPRQRDDFRKRHESWSRRVRKLRLAHRPFRESEQPGLLQ